ncbi:MAG: DsrE/DsrF-like family protein [Methanoregulaceae archaeon PtaB.Bin009]|jgi:tRNA 2-thiouridine synthesizing protein C|nr:MAG: DsrE/DsrF-like family protein [Methanoregulaceae archaeon PtaB.Bin009]
MDGNIFFTSEPLTAERLSWLVELLKYYTTRLFPESLHHHPRTPTPPFTFFLLGDACNILIGREHQRSLEIFFRLPCFRCIFDQGDLHVRRISIEPFRIRYPGQVIPIAPGDNLPGRSIWDCLMNTMGKTPGPPSIGFLQMRSPYMFQSSSCVVDLFRAAARTGISPEFYGYLDGVHAMHRDQRPPHHVNIGEALSDIYRVAFTKGLFPRYLICQESAASRGYCTFSGDNGRVVSASLIPQARIKSLDHIVSRFCMSHRIFSHTSFFVDVVVQRKIPSVKFSAERKKPSLVILASHSPYGTEFTKGAISLAVACAHQNIPTRIVFIEDGVYTLTGSESPAGMWADMDMHALIEATSRMDTLEYYVYTPSSQARGIAINPSIKGVCPVNPTEFSQVLLTPPAGLEVDHQRVLVF